MEFPNRKCACLHAALPQKPARILQTSYMLCANSFQSLLENTANFRQEFATCRSIPLVQVTSAYQMEFRVGLPVLVGILLNSSRNSQKLRVSSVSMQMV